MCTSLDPAIERLRQLTSHQLVELVQTLSLPALADLYAAAGIDDEAAQEELPPDDPNNWPCWCDAWAEAGRCVHALADRLRGMLARLTRRQAGQLLEAAGKRCLRKFLPPAPPARDTRWISTDSEEKIAAAAKLSRRELAARALAPCLIDEGTDRDAARFAAILALPPEQLGELALSLRLIAVNLLEAWFPRPAPEAKRPWYLPADRVILDEVGRVVDPDQVGHGGERTSVQALTLGRLWPRDYAEPPPGEATMVLPGRQKIGVMARRRGEGTAGDTRLTRANGLLFHAVFTGGDLQVDQVPKTSAGEIGREMRRLPNGHAQAGKLAIVWKHTEPPEPPRSAA